MIDNNVVATAKETNVVDLAGGYIELRKASANEYAGPCPKCGGEDRFHVKSDGWFCRQCKPIDPRHGWHDAVDFVEWMEGCTFGEAVETLTGNGRITTPPVNRRKPESSASGNGMQSEEWIGHAIGIVQAAHDELMGTPNNAGAEYLFSRNIQPHCWMAYRLGFWQAKNPDTHEIAPAVAIPWYRAGQLTAIKFRFVEPVKQKMSSEYGSHFKGQLYGGHAFSWHGEPQNQQAGRTLIVCEGELNAISIWQAHSQAGVDVLSIGSESASVPDAFVPHAQKYMQVIVWMDKPERVREVMRKMPGAYGINSPGGRDANDLLQGNQLTAFLTTVRLRAAITPERQKRIVDDMRKWMRSPNGYDAATVAILDAKNGKATQDH